MIKSITLHNFQSHRDSKLEFSPGVNVIIGSSDAGKSSTIRALRWVVENRPAGDEFRSDFAGKEGTEVSVELDSGQIITRVKSNGDNYYDLNGQPYRAFGQDVPDQIKQALNLSDINLQNQHDRPFLLDESPGAVARYLNKVVSLDKIDTTLANIESRKRQVNQEYKTQETIKANLEQAMAGFPDLEAAEEFIKGLEELQAELEQVNYTASSLKQLQHDINNLTTVLWSTRLPEGLEEKALSLGNRQVELDQISWTIDQLTGIQSTISLYQEEYKRLFKISIFNEAIVSLDLLMAGLTQAKQTKGRLELVQGRIHQARTSLEQVNRTIISQEKEFMEKFPDHCPLCGRGMGGANVVVNL